MSLSFRAGVLSLSVWALTLVPATAATIQVTVDTSTISGQAGVIDLQFNPGATSQSASALITAFTGATLGNVIPPTIGPVTGTLPTDDLTFQNSANTDYAHEVLVFGGLLQFRVTLDGLALTAPSNGLDGTSFFLYFYQPDFATPLLTSDSLIGQIDINPDGTITTTGFPTGSPVATFAVVSDIPEPSTWSSLILASGAFAVLLRRRSVS